MVLQALLGTKEPLYWRVVTRDQIATNFLALISIHRSIRWLYSYDNSETLRARRFRYDTIIDKEKILEVALK
jgi:hypothetical protein